MRRPSCPSFAAAFVLAVTLACSDDAGTQPDTSAAPGTPAAPVASVPSSPEVVALLAKADAADGTSDKVVSKCVMCGLAMPGKEANTVTVGDYAVQLCGAGEVAKFEADPAGSLKSALGG